jgi:hypothetical protein
MAMSAVDITPDAIKWHQDRNRHKVMPLLPLHIEIKYANVIDQNCKGPISQVGGGLAQDLVKHCAVGF